MKNYKDPCEMTRQEAEADLDAWEAKMSAGFTTWRGRDVEGHLEMLRDRLTILSHQEYLDRREGDK